MKNKEKTTKMILALAKGQIRKCTKLPSECIVFPKWSELGLWGKIFVMKARTKEEPNGHDYDEKDEQIVLRVLKGKLYMTDNMLDIYTLKQDKVSEWMQDKHSKVINCKSSDGRKNLLEVLSTIKNKNEAEELENLISIIQADFYKIIVPPQERYYIEITQELYDAGLTYCVNTWMEPDENGDADELQLTVGDYLICKPNENGKGFRSVYRIGHDEFLATHIIKDAI